VRSLKRAARAERFAAAVLDALPDATAVLDRTGTIVAVNRAWRLFALDNGGRPDSTGVGVNYLDVCDRAAAGGCADAAEVLNGLQAVLAGETVERDRDYPCPSSTSDRWFTLRMTPILGPTGGAVASHVNISRRKRSEEILAHQASHDPLTGLANRVLLVERLTAALLDRPGRHPVADVGLLYVDLDDFKPVNDTYGHDAGDEVLLTTAQTLTRLVRPQDTVARLGGDEFAVCAPRIGVDDLAGLERRISTALCEPQHIHGQLVSVHASIGVHLAGGNDTAVEALHAADRAMYAVKGSRHRNGSEGRRQTPHTAALAPRMSRAPISSTTGSGIDLRTPGR
jgi:diguanylate cyclase (GGDEF)-like protein